MGPLNMWSQQNELGSWLLSCSVARCAMFLRYFTYKRSRVDYVRRMKSKELSVPAKQVIVRLKN